MFLLTYFLWETLGGCWVMDEMIVKKDDEEKKLMIWMWRKMELKNDNENDTWNEDEEW